MIYLASPYTHPDPFVREERYLRAMKVVNDMLTRRIWAYSPIVHCHELAKISDLPRDHGFWFEYNIHMLSKAAELHVLRIDGWSTSKGVTGEILQAQAFLIPVKYV